MNPSSSMLPEHDVRPYSVNGLADRWDCSPSMIRKLIKANRLQPFRIGELIRISAAEVERYEKCQCQQTITDTPSSALEEVSPSSGGKTEDQEPRRGVVVNSPRQIG